jgi:hypothetical protein
MTWMYDADPFTARREVNERQARASQGTIEATQGSPDTHHNTSVSSDFGQLLEVKMASSLRDLVENAVKKVSCRQTLTVKQGKSLTLHRDRPFRSILKLPILHLLFFLKLKLQKLCNS